MDLVFATNNKNKLKEIKHMIIDKINVLSINDLSPTEVELWYLSPIGSMTKQYGLCISTQDYILQI